MMIETQKENVPKLRFPKFVKEWVPAKAGQAFKNRRDRGEAGLPIYSVTMGNGLVRRDSLDRLFGPAAADNSNLRASRGELIYNMMRMWQGAVGQAIEECMVSPAYVVLSPKKNTSSDFFYAWFKSHKMLYKLWAYSQGITSDRLRLYFDDFKQIPLHIPILSEQKKIAVFLGAVDEKLKGLRRKHDLLSDYKRGVMRKIFSQKVRFKRDDGSDFPDWEVRQLREIAGRRTVKNVDLSLRRVLTNSAVQGVVDQGDYFDKDIANAENIGGYYVIEKGDFVYNPRISVTAPVGPIKTNKLGAGIMSPLYTIFRMNVRHVDFFAQYFDSDFWYGYMKSVANYGARHDRMAITNNDFMGMPLPWPHPEEQRKIAEFLTALDTKIDVVTAQITQTEAFKKGLLQQMFV